jgi:hypothetical protein
MARCMVCSKIEGKNKLLIPKLDFFIKHSSLRRCSFARCGVTIFAYYVNPNNAHMKNEKM